MTLRWSDDQHEYYTADEDFDDATKRDLYYKMLKLIDQEKEVIKRVGRAQEEVHNEIFS